LSTAVGSDFASAPLSLELAALTQLQLAADLRPAIPSDVLKKLG